MRRAAAASRAGGGQARGVAARAGTRPTARPRRPSSASASSRAAASPSQLLAAHSPSRAPAASNSRPAPVASRPGPVRPAAPPRGADRGSTWAAIGRRDRRSAAPAAASAAAATRHGSRTARLAADQRQRLEVREAAPAQVAADLAATRRPRPSPSGPAAGAVEAESQNASSPALGEAAVLAEHRRGVGQVVLHRQDAPLRARWPAARPARCSGSRGGGRRRRPSARASRSSSRPASTSSRNSRAGSLSRSPTCWDGRAWAPSARQAVTWRNPPSASTGSGVGSGSGSGSGT